MSLFTAYKASLNVGILKQGSSKLIGQRSSFSSFRNAHHPTLRSKLFIPTLKETPVDAAIPSHQLLLRAGFMRKTSNGIYTLLPLGVRTLSKLEGLIDSAMESVHCNKLSMPSLQSSDLWLQTGRWETTGPELLRLQDRKGDDYCLGPTHEEIVTNLAATCVQSYKQLPLRVYQMGKKFRDEIRPRFGLLRSKEFIMKDAYTFDETKEQAEETYHQLANAYHGILKELKVPYVQVEADSGNIGGSLSHEFHILSKCGEDSILSCSSCDYAANNEKATGVSVERVDVELSQPSSKVTSKSDFVRELLDSHGNAITVHALRGEKSDTELIAIVPKERELNALKIKSFGIIESEDWQVSRANAHVAMEILGKQSSKVIIDSSISIIGLSENTRDVISGDILVAAEGDKCTHCEAPLKETRGIEVGHVFYLGTKYSKVLNAKYIASNQEALAMEMGCFGIGVTRLLAAIVESEHDTKGIRWPETVAPYSAVVISTGNKKGEDLQADTARLLASTLGAKVEGWEKDVVLDDRWGDSPGLKLTEAELIGYPWVIVAGRTLKKDGTVEVQNRRNGVKEFVLVDKVAEFITQSRA